MIRRLEELALNAWPALHTLLYDGWVLRFADGYTRRANSVHPLYGSTLDPRLKIEACEALYRQRGLRPIFKLTALARPEGLDRLLAERGYEQEALTSVQTADLAALSPGEPGATEAAEAVSNQWLDDFCRLSGADPRRRSVMRAMLDRIPGPHACATLRAGGETVACGLVVVEGGYAGLHDIVTLPAQRRRGYGRQLVLDLLAWARARGAHTAWLGVMADNAAALRLYAGAGFRERYQYWYRVSC